MTQCLVWFEEYHYYIITSLVVQNSSTTLQCTYIPLSLLGLVGLGLFFCVCAVEGF